MIFRKNVLLLLFCPFVSPGESLPPMSSSGTCCSRVFAAMAAGRVVADAGRGQSDRGCATDRVVAAVPQQSDRGCATG